MILMYNMYNNDRNRTIYSNVHNHLSSQTLIAKSDSIKNYESQNTKDRRRNLYDQDCSVSFHWCSIYFCYVWLVHCFGIIYSLSRKCVKQHEIHSQAQERQWAGALLYSFIKKMPTAASISELLNIINLHGAYCTFFMQFHII